MIFLKFIAHRGVVKGSIKENTMEAFIEAINNSNYEGFELDVRVSKDNEFVIHHNSFIDGKLVKNLDYKELKDLGVVRLKDVLKLKTKKKVFIEIKDFKMNLVELTKLLNKSKLNIYLMSFDNTIIKQVSTFKRKFKVGVLNYYINSEDNYNYLDFICLLYLGISEKTINFFGKQNIEVVVYGLPSHLKVKDYNVLLIADDEYVTKLKKL